MNIGFYLTVLEVGEVKSKDWVHLLVGVPNDHTYADIYIHPDKLFCSEVALSGYDLNMIYVGLKGGWK